MFMMGDRPTSWDLGACFGIDIHVHYTMPLFALYQIGGGFISGQAANQKGMEWVLFVNLLYVVILFLTVLIHEFGHSAMALKIGGTVEKILLWPFGGLAYCAFSREPMKQLAVSIAGPLTHLPMAAFWLLLWYLTTDPYHCPPLSLFGSIWNVQQCFIPVIALKAFRMQVLLFVFNMFFPVYPLDGGKILLSFMIMCCALTPPTAAKICIGTSSTLCLGLMAFSAWTVNWFAILLCFWILYQIYNMYAYLRDGRISEHPLFEHAPGGFQNPLMRKEDEAGYRLGLVN